MVSDKQLLHWYRKYNKSLFGGELPDDTILHWEPVTQGDAITCPVFETATNQFVIRLDPAIKGCRSYWHLTLIHEMVHVKLWPKHPKHLHGRLFQSEMLRIAQVGGLKSLW